LQAGWGAADPYERQYTQDHLPGESAMRATQRAAMPR
jgi:hypothetical protein